MGSHRGVPRGGRLLLTDALAAAWAVAWLLVALEVAQEIRDLGRISGTVARVGQAVADTGSSLEQLAALPVLGDRIADAGEPIREAGERARESAAMSRESADDLSTLLGASIAVLPNLPLLLLYLPQRRAVHRDRRAVAAMLQAGGGDELWEVLARRAVAHLHYDELQAVSSRPYDDLRAGRFDGLAAAELRRLGLPQPAAPGPRR